MAIGNLKSFILMILLLLSLPLQGLAKTLALNAPSGGDFSIDQTNNQKVSTADWRGSHYFLFFGFTNCKSVCPMAFSNLKTMYAKLTPAEQAATKVLFISIDNERDSAPALQKFLAKFDPRFLGATAEDKALKKILGQFGASFSRFKTKNNTLLIDHTSDIYLINRAGIWADTLKYDAKPDQLTTALRKSDEVKDFNSRFPHSRAIELIEPTQICNLQKGPCKIKILNQEFQVFLANKEIRWLVDNQIQVLPTSKASDLLPVEVDFEGVEEYMGYLRPHFVKQTAEPYIADFKFPNCELKKMNWKATLVFKNSQEKYYAVQFNLTSRE